MSPASQRKLREAWFGPFSADHLARRHHLPCGQSVRNFWAAEKAAGRLPAGTRPCFAKFAPKMTQAPPVIDAGAAVDQAADLALDREIELQEASVEGEPYRIPEPDPLLTALHAVHGLDPRRALDRRIAAVLGRYDAGLKIPSARMLALQARIADHLLARGADLKVVRHAR